jgi:hypothetical protein
VSALLYMPAFASLCKRQPPCHAQKGMIAELVIHITCRLGRHTLYTENGIDYMALMLGHKISQQHHAARR